MPSGRQPAFAGNVPILHCRGSECQHFVNIIASLPLHRFGERLVWSCLVRNVSQVPASVKVATPLLPDPSGLKDSWVEVELPSWLYLGAQELRDIAPGEDRQLQLEASPRPPAGRARPCWVGTSTFGKLVACLSWSCTLPCRALSVDGRLAGCYSILCNSSCIVTQVFVRGGPGNTAASLVDYDSHAPGGSSSSSKVGLLDTVLVCKVGGAGDQFIAISGRYQESAFGAPPELLATRVRPIRESSAEEVRAAVRKSAEGTGGALADWMAPAAAAQAGMLPPADSLLSSSAVPEYDSMAGLLGKQEGAAQLLADGASQGLLPPLPPPPPLLLALVLLNEAIETPWCLLSCSLGPRRRVDPLGRRPPTHCPWPLACRVAGQRGATRGP